MTTVSIIVPVYNVKEYLSYCIESLLSQTYTNFEVILVDDGSTDGSELICDQYAEEYPQNIRVIHSENKGPFVARTLGIDQANGKILLFLDGYSISNILYSMYVIFSV